MKVIITIDIPNGADVAFGDSDVPPGPNIPEEAMVVPVTPQFVPQQVIAPQLHNPRSCPVHTNISARHVPSGTIKTGPKAGRPYRCFVACGTPKDANCSWKVDCVEHPAPAV
jgi:hypothetical protein